MPVKRPWSQVAPYHTAREPPKGARVRLPACRQRPPKSKNRRKGGLSQDLAIGVVREELLPC
jgi:hypothetical protein